MVVRLRIPSAPGALVGGVGLRRIGSLGWVGRGVVEAWATAALVLVATASHGVFFLLLPFFRLFSFSLSASGSVRVVAGREDKGASARDGSSTGGWAVGHGLSVGAWGGGRAGALGAAVGVRGQRGGSAASGSVATWQAVGGGGESGWAAPDRPVAGVGGWGAAAGSSGRDVRVGRRGSASGP